MLIKMIDVVDLLASKSCMYFFEGVCDSRRDCSYGLVIRRFLECRRDNDVADRKLAVCV